MSLVVLSNQQSESEFYGQDDSIFKPYSFRNALSSTMTIPANSQVALQSAKINLDGSVMIGGDSKVFYLYFGQGIKFGGSTHGNSWNTIDDMSQSTAIPIRINLFNGVSPTRKVNSNELGEAVEKALRESFTHPQFVNRVDVQPKLSATGDFQGYEFVFRASMLGNGGAAAYQLTNYIPPTGSALDLLSWRKRYGGQANNWLYPANPDGTPAAGKFSLPFLFGHTQSVTFNVPPLANVGTDVLKAECQYDITEAVTGKIAGQPDVDPTTTVKWFVGLGRSSVSRQGDQVRQGARNNINPSYYRYNNGSDYLQWIKFFYDVGVFMTNENQGGGGPAGGGYQYLAGDMNVGQCVVDTFDNAGSVQGSGANFMPKMKVFPYWNDPSSAFTTGGAAWGGAGTAEPFPLRPFNIFTDVLNDGGTVETIKFMVNAEVCKIVLESTARTQYVITDYSNLFNAHENLKPLSQDCWNLYPMMAMNNQRVTAAGSRQKSLSIRRYSGSNDNFRVPGNEWVNADGTLATHNGIVAGGWNNSPLKGGYRDWNAHLEQNSQGEVVQELMGRPFINRGSPIYRDAGGGLVAAPNPVKYGNVTGTDPTDLLYNLQRPALILQDSDRYTPTPGATSSHLLGFKNVPVQNTSIDETETGSKVDWYMNSTSIPNFISTKSIFVRLDNYTQESVNAFRGNISKIIAHLPRFVQEAPSGEGAMYLEPAERVYLDLNNSDELKINSFDISLVYQDETYATSLQGSTIIVLHIRQKP